jgi:dephospho-CoA kinase
MTGPETGSIPAKTRIVAVSGGIGSGKSSVCNLLRSHGARIFNADETAKRLMETDEELRSGIEKAFGSRSYRIDGTLDRPYLAGTIFGNESRRREMNGLVHPRVRQAFEEAKRLAQEDGVPMFVHESALITEVDHRDQFDAIVIVESPLATRLERVAQRDRVDEKAVSARVDSQPTLEDFRRVADYIVLNDGSLAQLGERVASVYASIVGAELPPAQGL